MVHHVPSGPVHLVRTQPATQNMRFHVTFDSSLRELNETKRKLIIQKLIPEALDYFHKTLKVRASKLPIRLQHMCRERSYFLKDKKGKNKGATIFCKNACVKTYCGPVIIPEQHLDVCRTCNQHGTQCQSQNKQLIKGVKHKDFILYVASLKTQHCRETKAVAYASYCQQEHSLDRPIAGFANICPGEIQADPRHYPGLLATVKHEIFHALGFSAGLYAFYRDTLGRPLTRRDEFGLPSYNNNTNLYQWGRNIVRKITRKDWETADGLVQHDVLLMVTPKVKEEVRNHFRCRSLEGAEIENQGRAGTRWTHWEKRVFENEAMTGTYTQNPVFSRITLALMEDTGWYRVNYRMAEDLDWGKNLGCMFVKRSCRTWMRTRLKNNDSPSPFCFQTKQTPLHTRCTHSNDAVALCNLEKYSTALPSRYQYFNHLSRNDASKSFITDTRAFGGSVSLADYCPFYQKFSLTKFNHEARETACHMQDNSPDYFDNYALESYGPESKCVEQASQWIAKKGLLTRTMLDWGSGCYKYSCSDKTLHISVAGKKYKCTKRGNVLQINSTLGNWSIIGTLRCPECEQFCPGQCSDKLNTRHTPEKFESQYEQAVTNGCNPKYTATLNSYLTLIYFYCFTIFAISAVWKTT
jgi:leishmanolysin-like peptidase